MSRRTEQMRGINEEKKNELHKSQLLDEISYHMAFANKFIIYVQCVCLKSLRAYKNLFECEPFYKMRIRVFCENKIYIYRCK